MYKKPDECKGLLIDKIFSFQFNMSMDRLDEAFNNYCLLIDKLRTSHGIDLLDDVTGSDTVMAHLTFKKITANPEECTIDIMFNTLSNL